MITVDLPVPTRVLAIGAHPDDIEFGAGATLAKWAAAGAVVTMCVCTDGSKGTWDAAADLAGLVRTRIAEQRAAADVLGVATVEHLGHTDGELQVEPAVVAELCGVIRRTRPDVIVSHDPWRTYRLHPDHAAAGRLTIEALVAARDHHFFPEQGLEPHRPTALLLFEPGRVDHVESVTDSVDRKIAALLAHASQWRSTMGIEDPTGTDRFADAIRARARAAGIRAGLRAAEAFARLDDL
ncbi:MAG: PIG-L deacetylase family protein [Actinomycetota bacterium]